LADAIEKILSRNDTGETGGHQAGILVPKNPSIISFFPELDNETKNPRKKLYFIDSLGEVWLFNFIYYNNMFFGGTRNEYRLTGMTRYFRRYNLKESDRIILFVGAEDRYRIKHEYQEKILKKSLTIGSGWRAVNLKLL